MKLKKYLIIIAAILFSGALILFLFSDKWAEKILSSKISEVSFLSYDSLQLNLADGKLSLYNANIALPTLSTTIGKVSAEGISIFQLIANDKIIIEDIDFTGVDFNYYSYRKSQEASDKSSLSSLPKVLIKSLKIVNSEAAWHSSKDKKRLAFNFGLTLNNINQDDVKDPYRIASKVTQLKAINLIYITKDGLYNSGVKTLQLQNRSLKADSIYLMCNFEKYELGRYVRHEIDWYNLHIDSVAFALTNMEKLFKHHEASSITIYNPELLVFRDKRLPFPEGKKGKLLKDLLHESKFSIGIDAIEVNNGKITYQEYVKSGDGPGEVIFDRLNATFENLYTYDKKHNVKPRLKAKTALYGQSTLYADVSFPLDRGQQTIVKGYMMPMQLVEFNQMLKYVAFTELEDGQLDSLSFAFTYGDSTSKGNMNFGYTDLKIDFLNKQDAETGGFFNELKGFVANTLVVNSDNPRPNGKFSVGEIHAERNFEKSMFNFWWKSVLSGFRSSTGVKAAEEKIDSDAG
ncbi:MAG: hypothetical protein ABJH05_06985 [Fulvivirga sp.]